ncbi:MAG: hypothetical protein LBC84_09620, partial [Prevotellaceae bacterium]|nr:hypothetical protein [Prevotellaceae bacterium]
AVETCPPGYRHPHDGLPDNAITTGNPALSEIRQSLWLNPPQGINSNTDNSVWGYYADGYFDRRTLASSLGVSPMVTSAVATNSIYVAYVGRLFINPTTLASLFFPASGYRYNQSGGLYNAGGRGTYATKSTQDISNNKNLWYLEFVSSTAATTTQMHYDFHVNNISMSEGQSVRCVLQ